MRPASCPYQRGSVTIVAAAVLFLTGILALASVDVMRAVEAKARAQTAADAAALAAAQELALPSGQSPADAAAELAARNGAALVSCACDPGGSDAVVEVTVTAPMVLLGPDRTVMSSARAVVGGPFG
jgi:secretion/DNA translocation related TadE-like protein